MANILVYKVKTNDANVIATDLIRDGHNVSVSGRNFAERLRQGNFDIFFVDGLVAYELELRKSLNNQGLDKLPLLMAHLSFTLDDDLHVSGCDFGRDDITVDAYPSDIVKALIQYPIPKLDGIIHNPQFWVEENGVYLRR